MFLGLCEGYIYPKLRIGETAGVRTLASAQAYTKGYEIVLPGQACNTRRKTSSAKPPYVVQSVDFVFFHVSFTGTQNT